MMKAALEQIEMSGMPNYFGYQRFGTVRPNTHLVGRELVKGNLEAAVMRYLCSPYAAKRPERQETRRYLEETHDFGGALRIYPHRRVVERMILDALRNNPIDFVGVLRSFFPDSSAAASATSSRWLTSLTVFPTVCFSNPLGVHLLK